MKEENKRDRELSRFVVRLIYLSFACLLVGLTASIVFPFIGGEPWWGLAPSPIPLIYAAWGWAKGKWRW